jgi:dihydroorotase
MSATLVITDARLAGHPEKGGQPRRFDLVVSDGRVVELRPHAPGEGFGGAEVVHAGGRLLLPGLTDAHVHLREPGFEYKEDIASGLAAAAHGGFCRVMAMANTRPVNDCASVTRDMLASAAASWPEGPALLPVGALTKGLEGRELAPLAELAEAGCAAFSNDGLPVASSEVFRRAMEYAASVGRVVIDHCEDPFLAPGAGVNEGRVSSLLGLRGQPSAAEAIQVARDILLAEYLNIPIHLAHVSCRQSVELIGLAKHKGVPVTAETCPHYLLLTEDAVLGYDTSAKVSPPLRTLDDVLAMRQALAAGVVDILSTDHAPHAAHEKEVEFEAAPNGITGLDTALAATWSLVAEGALSEADLVRAWAIRPAEIFGLPVNRFQPGDPADFILFDDQLTWTVAPGSLHSRSKNTPLLGKELTGKVWANFIAGKRVV